MIENRTKSAVLFLVFNRPDKTKRVFEALRAAKPPRLYISADGPRDCKIDEAAKCAAVRAIVQQVDWPCIVRTKFNSQNLGCKYAVSGAIDWFFTQEEEGIILEDDVLPVPSFFNFCDELLEKYRDDERIAAIGGSNFAANRTNYGESYRFSRYCNIWGWATWRRSWQNYDRDMEQWPAWDEFEGLKKVSDGNIGFVRYWRNIFEYTYNGNVDTWDYQWIFSCWMRGCLCIVPKYNLVKNIGFGNDATHTFDTPEFIVTSKVRDVDFPIIHPSIVEINVMLDKKLGKKMFPIGLASWLKRQLRGVPIIGQLLVKFKKILATRRPTPIDD